MKTVSAYTQMLYSLKSSRETGTFKLHVKVEQTDFTFQKRESFGAVPGKNYSPNSSPPKQTLPQFGRDKSRPY
jgi:hypothetical protein